MEIQEKIKNMWLKGCSLLDIENALNIHIDINGKLCHFHSYMVSLSVKYEVKK